jgi:hypothetical protein
MRASGAVNRRLRRNVGYRVRTRTHLLDPSFTGFDPERTSASKDKRRQKLGGRSRVLSFEASTTHSDQMDELRLECDLACLSAEPLNKS